MIFTVHRIPSDPHGEWASGSHDHRLTEAPDNILVLADVGATVVGLYQLRRRARSGKSASLPVRASFRSFRRLSSRICTEVSSQQAVTNAPNHDLNRRHIHSDIPLNSEMVVKSVIAAAYVRRDIVGISV